MSHIQSMSLDVVILAAGKGTRMHSALPKVLHPLAGQPLLRTWSTPRARLQAERIVVVYGHGGEQVPPAFARRRLDVRAAGAAARHRPRRSAGAAAAHRGERTLVLYGDVPLIARRRPCSALLSRARRAAPAHRRPRRSHWLWPHRARQPRPRGAHRRGDATPALREKAIREINTGILAAPTAKLRELAGADLRNDNAQGEYLPHRHRCRWQSPTACRSIRRSRRTHGRSWA